MWKIEEGDGAISLLPRVSWSLVGRCKERVEQVDLVGGDTRERFVPHRAELTLPWCYKVLGNT